MGIKYTVTKKISPLILVLVFITSNICYAQQSCLRLPIGISSNRAQTAEDRVQFGMRLKGGALTQGESDYFGRKFEELARRLIEAKKAWTIFADREPRITDDYAISQYKPKTQEESDFFEALRKAWNDNKALKDLRGFDVVILDAKNGLPFDVVLHPGYGRQQAYIAYRDIKMLAHIYHTLDDAYKPDLINIILRAFNHEVRHILLKDSLRNKSPPEAERDVERNAPSFRAKEFFRLVYLTRKLKDASLNPDMNLFFKNLRKVNNKVYCLFAYLDLDKESGYLKGEYKFTDTELEQHLKIANELVPITRKRYAAIDVILAQHHIGHVLAHSDVSSDIFNQAVDFLKKRGIIDKGPETDSPYPVYKFVRELIFQNRIALMRDITQGNIVLSDLEQLKEWEKGDKETAGDSVKYPIPGETMALPVSLEDAKKVIQNKDMPLARTVRKEIISRLRENDKGHVIIEYNDLKAIGEKLLSQAATSTSAAGAGTRFALVTGFDAEGKPMFHDEAKAVLKIGGKSFVEMFLAQAAYRNKAYELKDKITCIIYTSHLTNDDVKQELERIGYSSSPGAPTRVMRYTHPDPFCSEVIVVRLHKTNLLDSYNADFFKNIDTSIDWAETQWPHGHDSTIVDLITSGLAYEMVTHGKRYVDISNIDNRAAGTDPIVLAMMRLANSPLINEIAVKPEGERGGGAPVHLKEPWIRGHRVGNLEKPNMDPKFLDLSQELTAKFLPEKNTANYCVDILEYTKQAFLNGKASNDEIIGFLREFYDARNDEEKKAELKFKKIEALYRINPRFIFLEASKKYPAVQTGSLLGMHSWLVNTLFLEVPQGDNAGKYTRFEEQKENVENLRRVVEFLKKEIIRAAQIDFLNENELFALIHRYTDTDGLRVGDLAELCPGNKEVSNLAGSSVTDLEKNISRVAGLTAGEMNDSYPLLGESTLRAGMQYAIDTVDKKKGSQMAITELLLAAEKIYDIQYKSFMRIQNKDDRYYPGETTRSLPLQSSL